MNKMERKHLGPGWSGKLLNLVTLLALILAAVAQPTLVTHAQGAQLVTNGDFSAGSTGWSASGSVGITSGVVYFSGGGAPVNGILWQDINTVAGQSYTMFYFEGYIGTLMYGGLPQLLVEARDIATNDILNSQVSTGSTPATYSMTFTAQGATRIRFLDQTTNGYDLDVALDNVSVIAPNTAPVAVNDMYSADAYTTFSFGAPGVLANDTDADGDPLTAVLVGPFALFNLYPDGSFEFMANDADPGMYGFSYQVYDGMNYSNIATVSVYVGNQAPVAVDDSYSTDQDTPLTVDAAGGVLANDTDVVGPGLTAVKVSDPANGAVDLMDDGSFTYTPNGGYYGGDSFTYKANDGALDSNTVTVNITVLPPVGDVGLLGYWKFDDGSGTAALDSSDYHRNGVLAGGAVFSASAAPISVYANPGSVSVSGATASKVAVPNSAINKLTNNFTVMGWINPSTVSGIQRVISSARTTSSGNGWSLGLNNTFLQFSTYGVKDYYTTQGTGMKAGQWYHIAAVMDSSNAVSFYINGVLVEKVTGAAPSLADADDVLLIGARTNSGASTLTDPFNGQIDDLRVYDHALSATEVADLVGVPSCSETVLRARVMVGENIASKTITLDGACTYTLTTADDAANGGSGLKISTATTIEGNGAIIERSAAAPQFRLMTTSPAITINNLTLRGGNVVGNGGGLLALGNLTLNNVRFGNNLTNHPTGVTYVQTGGALNVAGNLTADRCIFSSNQTDGYGGAVNFTGLTGRITNSIFADNLSGSAGASVRASNTAGILTLLNNTFADQYKNDKEALLINGAATLQNNLFYNFKSMLTASGATAVVNEDYNLSAAIDMDPQALSSAVITRGGHDRIAALPRFVDAAARNYHLQANSPAIDLGMDAGVVTDADGNARPFGSAADIGAYEYQGAGIPSVSITKVGPPAAAASGQTEFVLIVINEGTSSLDDLRISDTLPVGATYVAGSASDGGTLSGGTLIWDLTPLAPNQLMRVSYQVTATQSLVSDTYSVSSISTPAITASGPVFTTPYDPNYTALGFNPFPNGYGFANWGAPTLDSDITVADMPNIYGPSVCKTQSPCVLSAAAEAERQVLAAKSSGGHCGGMAMSSMWMYDTDVDPAIYQPGAINTFDLTKANARNLITYFHSTQTSNPADTTGLTPYTAASGAYEMVNTLLANFNDPNAATRYTLWFFYTKPDGTSGGHAVVPTGVKKIDDTHYWIYVYDVNYPNNFDRVFKVTLNSASSWDWVYAGAAANPEVPATTVGGDQTKPGNFVLKSLRWAERFPKACTTACAPDAPAAFNKVSPANGTTTATTTSATLSWGTSTGATAYHYCYDTTNDNACSSWYSAGTATSKVVSGLTANNTYYWQVRAINGTSPYTYADGAAAAFWSFKTASTAQPLAVALSWLQSITKSPATDELVADAPVDTNDPIATASASDYEFQLEGEGSLMVTRSDGLRAGFDPTTGQFIAEIPGAEQILTPTGLLNFPAAIRIPHIAGMTYALRVADVKNEYGNSSATADVNILANGFVTRLKGLKIDSPADFDAMPGSNDVLGVTFDGDNHSLGFTSSSLDSDTPTLGMAISQSGAPDFTFEVGGAQMPSGRSLNVAIDPTTGKLTIENDDPAANTYSLDVERINLDGSKLSYHFNSISDGVGLGTNIDLGPTWTGGAPSVNQNTSPLANSDDYTTAMDNSLAVPAPGVLSNDTGISPLTAVKVSDPTHGTLTLNADGSFNYTPNAGYLGSDSFTYKATHGLLESDVATVSIGILDATAPTVISITRASVNPTKAASVDFTIAFSEIVTAVDSADFGLTATGVSNAEITGVSGTGTSYTVTVGTGTGTGTIRLDILASANIVDSSSNPLSSLPYIAGQAYSVRPQTFGDVPTAHWSWNFIERLYNAGITGGCSVTPLNYCPETSVTRAQMAVFLLRSKHGVAYAPPAASGTVFADVLPGYWAAAWIEQLNAEGITAGCGNGNYCPEAAVTRDQMAVFLLRTEHGSSYVPPAPSGVFTDVPATHWAAAWIEQLYTEGITSGCGRDSYCPAALVTRAQMAVFLVTTFNLP